MSSTGFCYPELGLDQDTICDEPFNGDVVRFYVDDAKLSSFESVSKVCLLPVGKTHWLAFKEMSYKRIINGILLGEHELGARILPSDVYRVVNPKRRYNSVPTVLTKCEFVHENEPCQHCAKTGKDCGSKLRSDQDKPDRDEHNIETEFWKKVHECVKKRRQRRESWQDILKILDPDQQSTIVTDQTASLYPPGNATNPWEVLTSLAPTLPNQDSVEYPTNPTFHVAQSRAVPNLTTNYNPYETANFVDAPYVGGFTQTIDPRLHTLQFGQQTSTVNSAGPTNDLDGFRIEECGGAYQFYGFS
jgi:hypothetical protein